jgi:hypothetical protein
MQRTPTASFSFSFTHASHSHIWTLFIVFFLIHYVAAQRELRNGKHKEMSANRSDFFVNQSTGCLPVNMNNKGKIRKSGRETHTMAAKPRVSTEIKVYLERRSRHGL